MAMAAGDACINRSQEAAENEHSPTSVVSGVAAILE
jgi:hypothetical protein